MTTQTHTSDDRRKKRAAIARFVLAGVAVLGIGAAATSAAWTDNAWFRADAKAADVELQGSLDGASWIDADTSDAGTAVQIPAAAFGDLNQGASRPVTLHLRNDGTLPLTLGTPTIAATGDLFIGADPAQVAVTTALGATTLDPGDTTTFVITLTTSATWPASYQDAAGLVTVVVQGQS